jgi:hypothetical protein
MIRRLRACEDKLRTIEGASPERGSGLRIVSFIYAPCNQTLPCRMLTSTVAPAEAGAKNGIFF